MIELYRRYTLTMPAGEISDSGIEAIRNFLGSQRLESDDWKQLNPESDLPFLPVLPLDWEWRWIVQSGEYRGTLSKRIAKFYFKNHKLRFPDSVLAELGNLARRHTSMAEKYSFEFVDHFDWVDGDFGDDGSCLWSYNAGGRMMIEQNGGWAIRFYTSDGYGFARAWVVNVETDLYIVFNGYGLTTLQIVRILAFFTGKSYLKIRVRNHQSSQLFINDGGQGYAVGTVERLAQIREWVFDWTPIYVSVCYDCGTIIEDEDYFVGADEERYCENCFYERFEICSHCGRAEYREELTYIESTGEDVCVYCLDRHYTTCNQCGEFFRNRDVNPVGDRQYCDNCLHDLNVEGENVE